MDLLCFDTKPASVPLADAIVGPDAEENLLCASSESSSPCLVLFGRRADGQSVCLTVTGYRPWCRLVNKNLTETKTVGHIKALVARALHLDLEALAVKAEKLPKFYGFVPGPDPGPDGPQAAKWPCYKISLNMFSQASRLEKCKYDFVGLEFSELQTPHSVRAINELGLCVSGWASVAKWTTSSERLSTCNHEYLVDLADLRPRPDITAVAPLKIISFDAEMYSHDNNFPQVIRGDHTFAVCASVMTYGLKDLRRRAFVIWPKDRPLNTITAEMAIEYCDGPQDLFEAFRDFIVSEDPDLLTGWNIYGFDMPFMWDEYAAGRMRPSLRGSESLRRAIAAKLGHAFQTTSELLKTAAKLKRRIPAAKELIGRLEQRHRLSLHDPDELPEAVAGPLRAALRSGLSLEPEMAIGPKDLGALRSMDGPDGRLFKVVMDVPKYQSSRATFLSRLLCEQSSLTEKRMASSAKGDNTYYYWSGRSCVDLMQIIKDDKKLEDNSLKFSAQTFLDPEYGKIDLSVPEIFRAYRERDPEKMANVLDYCARDADIPNLLIMKLSYVPIWIEMSRVTYTPLQQVLNGGQQRKVYNLISRFIHDEYILNKADAGWPVSALDDEESMEELGHMEDSMQKRRPDYQGATVIEPKSGFYTESVSTLDFESLYPSIIIHFNLCPSVLVCGGPASSGPLDTLGLVYESHTIKHAILESRGPDVYREFDRVYTFAKNVQGVVPRLLQHLLKARKVAKKAMASASDEFERSVQNGRQLALKLSCNSVYGFFGVNPNRGLMSCKPVAAVTTLKGRAFIEASKVYVEAHYKDASVLYGDTDSIMIKWASGTSVCEAYKLAEEASASITDLLRRGLVLGASRPLLDSASTAVTLANEKVYRPYLLIQKKNYAAMKYTLKGGHKPEALTDFDLDLDMKGIDAVRRDRSKLVKSISENILQALLVKLDLSLALEGLKADLALVSSQKAPLDWFVLSKSLKGTYKSQNQPHVQAWKRMLARGDSDVPEVGTRMPFVVTQPKGLGSAGPIYLRTEHPDFVTKNKINYDSKYYLDNARDVVERLLGPTGKQHQVAQIFVKALEDSEAKSSGSMSLLSFKKLKSSL